ncbi:hypothetical protein QJS10_CPB14g00195 [Acorus calamus]|uniref:Uncharacterized protein n=1 Tax=Acorus calamus TaxID=4465 RepID=A0AAV9DCM7_ACOCL|nr:hypothetical protein QJS10_CPB14g00195 [Acorus calamus]
MLPPRIQGIPIYKSETYYPMNPIHTHMTSRHTPHESRFMMGYVSDSFGICDGFMWGVVFDSFGICDGFMWGVVFDSYGICLGFMGMNPRPPQ